ncbi:hypothetical protein D3C86_1373020 [compost metagenome]
MVPIKPHRILGRRHQLQILLAGVLQKIGDLVVAEVVMIRERALQHDLAAERLDGSEEFGRVGNARIGQHAPSPEILRLLWRDRRNEDGFGSLCRLPDQRIGRMAFADLQEPGHMPHLFGKRRSYRTARHEMAVADAAHRIDDNKRIIQRQARALETIIHDDEIDAFLHQPVRTFHPLAGNDRDRLARQEQGFIADIGGAVLSGIDKGGNVKRAAITAAEESGLQAFRNGGSRNCHRCRRLAGAAHGEVADADDRNGNTCPFCRPHPPAGNLPVKKRERRQEPRLPARFLPPERRRFRNHLFPLPAASPTAFRSLVTCQGGCLPEKTVNCKNGIGGSTGHAGPGGNLTGFREPVPAKALRER